MMGAIAQIVRLHHPILGQLVLDSLEPVFHIGLGKIRLGGSHPNALPHNAVMSIKPGGKLRVLGKTIVGAWSP